MTVILAGMNHETAPVQLRERFFLADPELTGALHWLHSAGLAEAAILSTCNRFEIAAFAPSAEEGFEILGSYFGGVQGADGADLQPHLYFYEGEQAVGHLMRVASGVDSLVIGESEILGQVLNALNIAQSAGAAGPILSRLFDAAIHAGKRARQETGIGRHTLSVSQAAALLVAHQSGDLAGKRVTVLGAGEMAKQAIRALVHQGAEFEIAVVNRTNDRAAGLAAGFAGVDAVHWRELAAELARSDAVIAATGAVEPVITAADLEQHPSVTAGKPVLIVDIGVPRNVDADVRDIPSVSLFDIDDLRAAVDRNRRLRESEIPAVEAIVAEDFSRYLAWLQSREVVPLLVEIRRHADAVAEEEIRHALQRLPGLTPSEREIINQLGHRIVGKLLHAPTLELKSHAEEGERDRYADAVKRLFGDGIPPLTRTV